ncbi:MAG: hypothetical protein CMJ18_17735 [Phycisphaeraceae bacterium]|nr:hypothetical protein [Phycisphaeraceae bacterium]
MPTITACSTLTFALSPLDEALAHIAGYGFRHVEIADMLTHAKHFQIDTVDPVSVRDSLSKHGLTAISSNITLATLHRDQPGLLRAPTGNHSSAETEEVRRAKRDIVYYRLHVEAEANLYVARVRTLIEKAKVAGIPRLVLNTSRKTLVEDIDAEIEATAALFDELAESARDAGIQILLEMPHVWQLYYDANRAKQMLGHLKSDNIGVLVDSTHWHVSGYDIDDYLGFVGDRLRHVHLRDAAGSDSSAGKYKLEITPGDGEVDFGRLARVLDAHGYEGTVTLETEYKNYKDPSEVDDANARALTHLESVGWDVLR